MRATNVKPKLDGRKKAPLESPHERDERPEPESGVRPVVQRAAKDLQQGQVDTDNYTRAGAVTKTTRKR